MWQFIDYAQYHFAILHASKKAIKQEIKIHFVGFSLVGPSHTAEAFKEQGSQHEVGLISLCSVSSRSPLISIPWGWAASTRLDLWPCFEAWPKQSHSSPEKNRYCLSSLTSWVRLMLRQGLDSQYYPKLLTSWLPACFDGRFSMVMWKYFRKASMISCFAMKSVGSLTENIWNHLTWCPEEQISELCGRALNRFCGELEGRVLQTCSFIVTLHSHVALYLAWACVSYLLEPGQ